MAAAVVMKPSDSPDDAPDARFSVADYRYEASRLVGNSYRMKGRVENIDTRGKSRFVLAGYMPLPSCKKHQTVI